MEVKEEYIEFLRMYRDSLVQEGKLSDKSLSYNKLGDIIALLQQGEKHRQQDLKTIQFYIRYYNMWNVLKANTDKETINYMNKLEQKYFPKEEKNEIKVGRNKG